MPLLRDLPEGTTFLWDGYGVYITEIVVMGPGAEMIRTYYKRNNQPARREPRFIRVVDYNEEVRSRSVVVTPCDCPRHGPGYVHEAEIEAARVRYSENPESCRQEFFSLVGTRS